MELTAVTLFILFSLVGFAAIFFTTFGTLIILLGGLAYAGLTEFAPLTLKTLLFVAAWYILGEIIEYLCVILGMKKSGASNWAVIGALFGGIVGAVIGTALLGVGVFIGALLGIFGGAFLAELLVFKDYKKSFIAGVAGVLGRLGSIIIKVLIAFIMIGIMVKDILN
jgi:uncharacterized protein